MGLTRESARCLTSSIILGSATPDEVSTLSLEGGRSRRVRSSRVKVSVELSESEVAMFELPPLLKMDWFGAAVPSSNASRG